MVLSFVSLLIISQGEQELPIASDLPKTKEVMMAAIDALEALGQLCDDLDVLC